MFEEFNHFFKNEDNDDTSGTSDFDTSNDTDPDDCYCESEIFESGHFSKYAEGVDLSKARGAIPPRSNAVYTKDTSIKKVDNFPFDKVYFGTPHKLPLEFKLNGPLFVTPYPGVASIFAVRPQHVSKYGVRGYCNRDYDEFKTSLKDTLLKKPLSELHVRLQCNDDIKPVVELVTGNIYELEVTSEIRDHIYQSSKMHKYLEFCIDKLPSVTFSSVKKVNVCVYITGEKLTQTEAFYTELKKELGQTKEPQPYQESKLPAKKRNSLKDSDFALVYTDEKGKKVRKYPVHDKAHVESAARMFGHCPLKYKAKLARKILSRAHEYGIDTSGWTQVNKFSKSK